MPKYVERNILLTSASHVRVNMVRDLRIGAYYSIAYIFCPNEEVCEIVARNLMCHFTSGPLAPWVVEVRPVAQPERQHPAFPKVLH